MNVPPTAAAPPRTDSTGRGLRRFLGPAPAEPERCELCGIEVSEGHRHLVDTEARSLACACRPCALLFDRPGAGAGRFRTVPDRCLTDSRLDLDTERWAGLRIPVSIAFFFHNSTLGRPVALYPSPAGATETEIEPDAWQRAFGDSPLATLLAPDVEALLVRRAEPRDAQAGAGAGPVGGDGGACYLVPVDVAYELVGRLRLRWQGFDGGAEVRSELADFFHRLAQRATEAPRASGKDAHP